MLPNVDIMAQAAEPAKLIQVEAAPVISDEAIDLLAQSLAAKFLESVLPHIEVRLVKAQEDIVAELKNLSTEVDQMERRSKRNAAKEG